MTDPSEYDIIASSPGRGPAARGKSGAKAPFWRGENGKGGGGDSAEGMNIEIGNLLDLSATIAAKLFEGKRYPWEVLPELAAFIRALGASLPEAEYRRAGEAVWTARDALVAPTACLNGPLIVDRGAEIRHCAFVRGSAIVGKGAVVGNSTELKNCVLFDGAQAPHFNYVGDAVLGARAHLGAGAVTSNVRSDKRDVVVHAGADIPTGLRKLGAMVGDRAEIGCNAVLNPGTVVGRDAIVYPASCARGVIPENHIFKGAGAIVARREEAR